MFRFSCLQDDCLARNQTQQVRKNKNQATNKLMKLPTRKNLNKINCLKLMKKHYFRNQSNYATIAELFERIHDKTFEAYITFQTKSAYQSDEYLWYETTHYLTLVFLYQRTQLKK